MSDKTYTTASGKVLTEADFDAIADEVEHAEFDVEIRTQRRRGRPAMGSTPAEVVAVLPNPELQTEPETGRAPSGFTSMSAKVSDDHRALKPEQGSFRFSRVGHRSVRCANGSLSASPLVRDFRMWRRVDPYRLRSAT